MLMGGIRLFVGRVLGKKRPLSEDGLRKNILVFSSTGERELFESSMHDYLSRFGNAEDLSKPLSAHDPRTPLLCAIAANSETVTERLLELGVKPTKTELANAALNPRIRKILEARGFVFPR